MAMSRNITLPLVAAGGAATKFALDFDTSMRQIVALTDVTADQVEGIKDQIFALGAEVGKTPQELAEAFYFVASAGFEAEGAMEVLETSARASAAGMGETQDIAKVLGATINAYGAENITAAEAADQLTAAVGKGSAEAADFAAVIGRVVPVAATMGVEFDEVTAALAAMTNVGIDADTAATSLRQVLVSLLKPTTQAEEALRGMGTSSEALRTQLREEGLLSTLRTLEERFAGNETATAAVFGNVRALTGVTALLGIETDQLNGIFGATADAAGALGEAYEDTEGPGRELGRSMSRLQAAAISIGEDVLPLVVSVLEEVAKAAEGLAEWWRSLDDDTQKLIVQVLAFTAVAGPALVIIGKIALGIGAIFNAIKFLTGAKGIPAAITVVGRFATSLLGIPVLLYAAQQAAREVGPDIAKALGTALFGEDFGDFHQQASEVDGHIQDAKDQWIESLLGGKADMEGALADVDFSALDKEAQRAFQAMNATARAETVETALIAAGVPPEVAAILAEGAEDVGDGAEAMLKEVDEEAIKAREAAIAAMSAMVTGIANLFDTDDQIREAWQALLDRMDDPYTEKERLAQVFGLGMPQAIQEGLASGDPGLMADVASQTDRMLAEYEALVPGGLENGRAAVKALNEGMDDELDDVLTWFEEQFRKPILEAYDTREEAEKDGFGNIWAYAQGVAKNERAALDASLAIQRATLKPLEEGVGLAGTAGSDSGGAFGSGVGSPSNVTNARNSGAAVAGAARGAMWWDARRGGYDIGYAWTVGLRSAMYASAQEVGLAMGHIKALMGGSLPTAGPLQHPDTGGRSIGEAWGAGLLGGLAKTASGVGSAMGLIGSELAFQPAFAGMGGMTVPRASAVSGTGTTITNVTNNNLNVSGRLSVDDAADAIEELDRLGGR